MENPLAKQNNHPTIGVAGEASEPRAGIPEKSLRMSMHFERATSDAGAYAEIELRTDTRLAATLRATRSGVSIDVAEGFLIGGNAVAEDMRGSEIYIEIRERES